MIEILTINDYVIHSYAARDIFDNKLMFKELIRNNKTTSARSFLCRNTF